MLQEIRFNAFVITPSFKLVDRFITNFQFILQNAFFSFDFILYSFSSSLQSSRIPTSATLDSCTCCVIKPHAVKAKAVGKILDIVISQGYDVSAISSVHFDKIQAEEFYEVYKGVVPEYSDHVLQVIM